MSTPVTMPKLGESVVEGTVARWLKSPGDAVSKLEPLLEINTDKIDTEVPAPAAGTLLNIVVPEGETVEAGTVLAYIGNADEAQPDDGASAQKSTAVSSREGMVDGAVSSPASGRIAQGATPRRGAGRPLEKPVGRAFISPVVKRIAAEHGVQLDDVQGTGMRGRITKADIQEYVETLEAEDEKTSDAQAEPVAVPSHFQIEDIADERLEPLSLMRQAIAKHMAASKRTSPHVTTIFEVDMTAVVRHRESQKETAARKGVRLTFTAYFVAAAAQALRSTPAVNARYVDDDGKPSIMRSSQIHVGVAVALDEGLIVPVIRNADERSLFGLARHLGELASAARTGQLTPDATQGGTFTITNHGVSGSLIGTPIINQPQAGILGIGAIVKRPVVRSATVSLLPSADDAIVIRPMCYVNFSFDHRILDGAQADQFVAKVKDILENWSSSTL